MCQITYFFGKRPELSQKKSGTTFFKARYQFFFGISRFFLIRHKRYPQNDHSFIFFWKKSWFSIFFWQFFLQILSANFFEKFFSKKKKFLNVILMAMLVGNYFFSKIQKKYVIMPYKTFSSCFLKQLGSFFQKGSIFTHRFHSE